MGAQFFLFYRARFSKKLGKMDLKNCDCFCKEQIENDFFLSTTEKTSECWKLWSEKTRLRLVVPLLVDNAEWRLGHRPIIFVGISLDLNVAYHVDSFAIIWFLNPCYCLLGKRKRDDLLAFGCFKEACVQASSPAKSSKWHPYRFPSLISTGIQK